MGKLSRPPIWSNGDTTLREMATETRDNKGDGRCRTLPSVETWLFVAAVLYTASQARLEREVCSPVIFGMLAMTEVMIDREGHHKPNDSLGI